VKIKHFSEKVEIDICKRCGGSWYDKDEMAVHIDDVHVRTRLANFPEVGADSTVTCPRCGGKMKLRHEGEVEVDFCVECRGVWLDLGEKDALRYQIEWDAHREEEELVRITAFQTVLGDEYF
jgi:Zn-finger nucleic acid-binding protein